MKYINFQSTTILNKKASKGRRKHAHRCVQWPKAQSVIIIKSLEEPKTWILKKNHQCLLQFLFCFLSLIFPKKLKINEYLKILIGNFSDNNRFENFYFIWKYQNIFCGTPWGLSDFSWKSKFRIPLKNTNKKKKESLNFKKRGFASTVPIGPKPINCHVHSTKPWLKFKVMHTTCSVLPRTLGMGFQKLKGIFFQKHYGRVISRKILVIFHGKLQVLKKLGQKFSTF